jgi:hypothetical protein
MRRDIPVNAAAMVDQNSNTLHNAAGMSTGMTTVFAVACGMMVANLYYAQALIGEIAPALGLHGSTAGLIVTLTQLGYGAGLLLIVSLADLVENRRLILTMVVGTTIGLIGVVFSTGALSFLVFSFVTGFCSVGAQIMVPLAAHLAPDAKRGQVIGNIMGGLITGIMLARPLASALASFAGWRAIFAVSAVAMVALALLLAKMLPERRPSPGLGYREILASSFGLLVKTPAIRRRTAYQATVFAIFNLFWTAVPLVLAAQFGLGQGGIRTGRGGRRAGRTDRRTVGRSRLYPDRDRRGARRRGDRLPRRRLGGRGAYVGGARGGGGAARRGDAVEPGARPARDLFDRAGSARADQRDLYDCRVPWRRGGIDAGVVQPLSWRLERGGLAAAAFLLFLTEPRGDHTPGDHMRKGSA